MGGEHRDCGSLGALQELKRSVRYGFTNLRICPPPSPSPRAPRRRAPLNQVTARTHPNRSCLIDSSARQGGARAGGHRRHRSPRPCRALSVRRQRASRLAERHGRDRDRTYVSCVVSVPRNQISNRRGRFETRLLCGSFGNRTAPVPVVPVVLMVHPSLVQSLPHATSVPFVKRS